MGSSDHRTACNASMWTWLRNVCLKIYACLQSLHHLVSIDGCDTLWHPVAKEHGQVQQAWCQFPHGCGCNITLILPLGCWCAGYAAVETVQTLSSLHLTQKITKVLILIVLKDIKTYANSKRIITKREKYCWANMHICSGRRPSTASDVFDVVSTLGPSIHTQQQQSPHHCGAVS